MNRPIIMTLCQKTRRSYQSTCGEFPIALIFPIIFLGPVFYRERWLAPIYPLPVEVSAIVKMSVSGKLGESWSSLPPSRYVTIHIHMHRDYIYIRTISMFSLSRCVSYKHDTDYMFRCRLCFTTYYIDLYTYVYYIYIYIDRWIDRLIDR